MGDEFRFKIGEEVMYFKRPEIRFVILQRQLDECVGGVQRKYLVRQICEPAGTALDRAISKNWVVANSVLVHEFELLPAL